MNTRVRLSRSTALFLWPLIAFALLACIVRIAATAADAPTKPSPATEKKIKDLEAYYAKLYGVPLDSPDRLPREIAIISLSRIDAPDILQRLFDALKPKDRDPIIAYLVWEALHARHSSMSAEQRQRWTIAGLQAANAGAFPGATVTPLLRAMAEQVPTIFENEPAKLASRVIQENDLQDAKGRAALDALADLVAAWHDPALIRAIIANLSHPEWVARVDHALHKLPDSPDQSDSKKLAGLWRAWPQQHAQLKAATTDELKPYIPSATLFLKPDRITDPLDKRWHAELEIGKLVVSDFDLVWCIDSTGSMNEENQIVAAETDPVVRACSLISKRARCGVIYYRHETDASIMKPCCQRAANDPRFYQVKGYPLTTDGKAIAAKMAAEPIPKPDRNEGNVHPGSALHAAVKAAMGEMNWSTDKHARRVIAVVGDAPITPGSEKACEELGTLAKSKGYLIHALIRPRVKESWDPFIKSSGATYMPFAAGARPIRPKAIDPASELAEIMTQVVSESVGPEYRDRVEPLVKMLIPYAKSAELAEQRSHPTPPRN